MKAVYYVLPGVCEKELSLCCLLYYLQLSAVASEIQLMLRAAAYFH